MLHKKLDSISSTQDFLKENLAEFLIADNDVLVSTKIQTDGVGRQGNKWDTAQSSLAFSFNIMPSEVLTLTPLEIGILISEYFLKEGADIKLKWPNDLLISENKILKKCGGILCNFFDKKNLIAGVGLNLFISKEQREKNYKMIPGGIFSEFESFNNYHHDIPIRLVTYIKNNRMSTQEIQQKFLTLCAHKDQLVEIGEEDSRTKGKFLGIGNEGEAILDCKGVEKKLVSGSLWILT